MRKSLASLLVVMLVACGGMGSVADGGVDAGKPAPKLSGLPDCGTPADAGTAVDLYNPIIIAYGCGSGGCHGGTPPNHFEITGAASFRARMLEKSAQVPELNRVTPGDIHTSYLIYKLWGQHADAGYPGFGERMPHSGPYLTDAEFCSVVNWVNAGAP